MAVGHTQQLVGAAGVCTFQPGQHGVVVGIQRRAQRRASTKRLVSITWAWLAWASLSTGPWRVLRTVWLTSGCPLTRMVSHPG